MRAFNYLRYFCVKRDFFIPTDKGITILSRIFKGNSCRFYVIFCWVSVVVGSTIFFVIYNVINRCPFCKKVNFTISADRDARYRIAVKVCVIKPTAEIIIITGRRIERKVLLYGIFSFICIKFTVIKVINYIVFNRNKYCRKHNVFSYSIREFYFVAVNSPTTESIARFFGVSGRCRKFRTFLNFAVFPNA